MSDQPITAILAHDRSIPGARFADQLAEEPSFVLTEVVASLDSGNPVISGSRADVLVVGCQADSAQALALVNWWSEARPGASIIVLCGASVNGFVREAFTAGADDLVVVEPLDELTESARQSIVFALQKAVARRSAAPAEAQPKGTNGKIVCVLGPKGGVGKTLTSTNLSVALAQRSRRVALVDLDLQFGDVALSLGLAPEQTVYDLAVAGGELDADKLDGYLLTHATGLRVLAAPVRPDQAAAVTPEFVAQVLRALRGAFDYVVIDTQPAFGPEVITSVDVATYVCMVGMLDALSLKNTRLGLETLDLMGYEADRIRIVLNRANTSVGITRSDVVGILGRPPDVLVPSHRDIARSVNEGTPVVLSQAKSDVARAMEQLCALFFQPIEVAAVAPPPAQRRGLRFGFKERS